jgi:isoleucyl-tRNA synthetase
MLAMSAGMENREPFKNLFGYALLRDENGEEMHKSKGNAIWFEDAAERMGADVMRWLFLRANPVNNLNFGWNAGDEIKRGFLSTLWNTYSFFVTYANIDGWTPGRDGQTGRRADGQEEGLTSRHAEPVEASDSGVQVQGVLPGEGPGGVGGVPPDSQYSPAEQRDSDAQPSGAALSELDRWALSELNQLVATVTNALENYDAMTACRQIEDFVEGLSNWYVRRSRRRFWKSEDDGDKRAAYETLYTCLETLNRLMAPLVPFLSEEIYQNLVRTWDPSTGSGQAAAPESVHLRDWPAVNEALIDRELSASVRLVQRLTSLGRAARAKANVKVRQPLAAVHVKLAHESEAETVRRLADQVVEELNVKALDVIDDDADFFDYQVRPNLPVLGPKYGSEVGRIQRALAQADKAALARQVNTGQKVPLDGLELEPSELLVTVGGKPGYAVAEEAGYAVAVTTEVTPELAAEGLARELVRRIQELRKSAGLEIADRVHLYIDGDDEVARVVEGWRDYISQETLASAIEHATGGDYSEEQDVDGHQVRLGVTRALMQGSP